MSRDYFAVFAKMFRLPKFRHLDEQTQLTLFYVWAIAGDQDPEATWADLDALGDNLDIQGRDRADAQVLLDKGWLDQLASGEIIVHDWDEWQKAASRDIRRKYEAHRKRRWRRDRDAAMAAATPGQGSATPAEDVPFEDVSMDAEGLDQTEGVSEQTRYRSYGEGREEETREEERRDVRDMSGTWGENPLVSVGETLRTLDEWPDEPLRRAG